MKPENAPVIQKENIMPLVENRFLNMMDIRFGPDRHYYFASRRKPSDLMVLKDEAEFKASKADAVTCVLIVRAKSENYEPRLVLFNEFRYPTGQFLLSPPAGVRDPEDPDLFTTARREIYEETGLKLTSEDEIRILNPLLFSSPGMTDESNALMLVDARVDDLEVFSHDAAEETECFSGFCLLTKAEAREILKRGTDDRGIFYSVFTQLALLHFIYES